MCCIMHYCSKHSHLEMCLFSIPRLGSQWFGNIFRSLVFLQTNERVHSFWSVNMFLSSRVHFPTESFFQMSWMKKSSCFLCTHHLAVCFNYWHLTRQLTTRKENTICLSGFLTSHTGTSREHRQNATTPGFCSLWADHMNSFKKRWKVKLSAALLSHSLYQVFFFLTTFCQTNEMKRLFKR